MAILAIYMPLIDLEPPEAGKWRNWLIWVLFVDYYERQPSCTSWKVEKLVDMGLVCGVYSRASPTKGRL